MLGWKTKGSIRANTVSMKFVSYFGTRKDVWCRVWVWVFYNTRFAIRRRRRLNVKNMPL